MTPLEVSLGAGLVVAGILFVVQAERLRAAAREATAGRELAEERQRAAESSWRSAHSTLTQILHAIQQGEFAPREFDAILAGLPRDIEAYMDRSRAYAVANAIHNDPPDRAAEFMLLTSAPATEVTLRFEPIRHRSLYYQLVGDYGWRRNGWVLIPVKKIHQGQNP